MLIASASLESQLTLCQEGRDFMVLTGAALAVVASRQALMEVGRETTQSQVYNAWQHDVVIRG